MCLRTLVGVYRAYGDHENAKHVSFRVHFVFVVDGGCRRFAVAPTDVSENHASIIVKVFSGLVAVTVSRTRTLS